jgi:hypothetical protein
MIGRLSTACGTDSLQPGTSGKDDPNLALLRLDPEHAEIWLNANSLVAGIRILFGRDPKEDYKENVAKVTLR